jgi:hypothetical protein
MYCSGFNNLIDINSTSPPLLYNRSICGNNTDKVNPAFREFCTRAMSIEGIKLNFVSVITDFTKIEVTT